MKNKGTLIAGLGLGAALTLSVLSFSSANETVDVTATTSTNATKTTMPLMGKKLMKVMHGDVTMMDKRGGFMVRFGGPNDENSAIQEAITNNDYNAFVNARNNQWSADENKPADAIVPTQEQFTEMVNMETKRAAIEKALETNDYDGYVKATTPTRDEFTQMSQQHQAHKAIQAAIEAKDYDAFRAAAKNTPMADMTEEDFNNMSEGKMMKFEKRAEKIKTTTNQ